MADPFAHLRLPLTPLAPRRDFATELRRRIEAAIHGTDPEGAPMPTTDTADQSPTAHQPQPLGATSLVPSLIAHDARAAIRFYVEGMGATLEYRFDDGDRIGHAELQFGLGIKINVADPYPELGINAPDPGVRQSVSLRLTVPDVDAAFERAIAHGAVVERPVEDQFYGDRAGSFRDPFGHSWTVSTPIPGHPGVQ